MKKRIGQVFSLALVVAILVSMSVSAFAADSSRDTAGFWDWNAHNGGFGGSFGSTTGYVFGQVCASSPDSLHHSDSMGHFGGTDENGRYTICTCKHCGEQYRVYKSDLQQSYDAQVAELPATGYSSDGSLFWSPEIAYVWVKGVMASFTCCPHYTESYTPANESLYTFDCANRVVVVRPSAGEDTFFRPTFRLYFAGKYPIDGYYKRIQSLFSDYTFIAGSFTYNKSFSYYPESSATLHYAGVSYDFFESYKIDANRSDVQYVSFPYCPPVYEVTPFNPSGVGDTYNINSRPTSITGDYGIIGDNGQIVKVEGNKIVNETNNIYTNPATGQTDTITNWSYDYSTRTYTLTLGGGTTTTVTYGDENVVIKEGDTTYNIYYLINGSGPENPDPGPDVPGTCNHQWAETSTTPATCTVPGSRLLTCSLCNETKTEAIPAPGHKWVIKQEVKNEYDSSGNQTQEGYTIWECSVCGEQQKTTDGTAPPGGGGSGSGSSGGVFSGIFGLLVDFLGFFWNTFRDFVGEGVKGFLTALMDGTSSIFGLLNPFNWGG